MDIWDQINEISFELGMKTILMSMNFAVVLIAHLVEHCTGIAELTVQGFLSLMLR